MDHRYFPLIIHYIQCTQNQNEIKAPDYGWKFYVPLFGSVDDVNFWTSTLDRQEASDEAAKWVRDYIMERNPFPPEDEPRLVWVPYGKKIRWVTQDHIAEEL